MSDKIIKKIESNDGLNIEISYENNKSDMIEIKGDKTFVAIHDAIDASLKAEKEDNKMKRSFSNLLSEDCSLSDLLKEREKSLKSINVRHDILRDKFIHDIKIHYLKKNKEAPKNRSYKRPKQ